MSVNGTNKRKSNDDDVSPINESMKRVRQNHETKESPIMVDRLKALETDLLDGLKALRHIGEIQDLVKEHYDRVAKGVSLLLSENIVPNEIKSGGDQGDLKRTLPSKSSLYSLFCLTSLIN